MYALIVAYATLYPFVPLRPPGGDALAALWSWRYIGPFDCVLNVLAYAPLGAFAFLVFQPAPRRRAVVKAAAACAAFSFALETCQLFITGRHASVVDFAANTSGGLIGALFFTDPFHALVTQRLAEWRGRIVIDGAWGDGGLMLLAVWLLAQLNPALPFFEAGNIGGGVDDSVAARVLPSVAVALSVCGFGLFVSVVLRGPGGAMRTTLVLLTLALWLKFATASMMLKPHLSADWLSTGRAIGLAAGILVFMPLRRFARPARIYLAMLMLLAGALFSKVFGAYSAATELLRLFSWPYGQLLSFATLTRYLHEVWPFAAIVFLVALFLRERRTTVP